MCKWESASAEGFITVELIHDWTRTGELNHKSPLLDPDTKKVGISNKAHPKTVNLIQILYLKAAVNAMG